MKNKLLVFFIFLLLSSYSQNNESDSLVKLLNTEKVDTSRIHIMLKLAGVLQFNNPNKAYEYIQKSILLGKKINYNKQTHKAYRILGIIYATTGKLDSSKIAFKQSLDFALKYGNKVDIGNAYNNIGINKYYEGDFLGANEYYLKSLKIMESINHYTGIANVEANLGNVNFDLRKYKDAENNYLKAAENYKKANNNIGMAQTYNDIGRLYLGRFKDHEKALKFFDLARKELIANEIYNSLVANYSFSAEANIAKGDYITAKIYSDSSNYYNNFIGDSLRLAQNYVVEAKIHTHYKEFDKAKEAINKAIKLAKNIQATTVELDAEEHYANLLYDMGNSSEAFLKQKDFINLKDSIFDSENAQQLQQMQTMYQTDKKETENLLLQKENEIKNDEIKDYKITRNYLIGILGLSVLIIAGTFFFYQKIKKSNKLLDIQKKSIEQKNNLLEIQKKEVEEKNELIEEKNKEITDSINYASRIQTALLPSAEEFQRALNDSFVLFQPKDIVSGDFYWETETSNFVFYATADCTGHGVPGGFMSMLGMALLNEIIGEKKIYEPCDILDMMRVKLIVTLKQKGLSGENKDGMDMVLCRVDKNKRELVYAAANNPLWLCRNGEIIEYKANKQPVGIFDGGELAQFDQQKIELKEKDIIYTFTDGFADQFGGPKGKKFKYKQLEEILIENSKLPMDEQKNKLKDKFALWKGKLEQVDDVCIIGVRF